MIHFYISTFSKKILPIILLLTFFSFNVLAQTKLNGSVKISGKVVDSLSNQAIEYATISLFSQNDNKIITGVMADSSGVFKISNVPDGTYKIGIEFIGYKKSTKKNIVVSKKMGNISLGTISLPSKHIALQEVTVFADKNLIENKIDKMVYNVEKDVSSQSGVAVDVLKKVPQVSVDVDGNVELQGNTNIRFLIDGKPSILYGSNIADVLQSIPASQIQSIDVITSPGSKYDAEGTGGIINIILKKNNARGANGSVSLSGGTRLENGSLNLSFRKGTFGANAFLSGNAQLLSTTINSLDRRSHDSLTSTQLLQNGKSDFSRTGYQSGFGFDWDISPKDNITGTLGYNFMGNSNAGSTNRQTILRDNFGNQLSSVMDSIVTSNSYREYTYNASLGYKKKFATADKELEVLLNSSNGTINNNYDETQSNELTNAIFSSSIGKNPGIHNETNVEINYVQPLPKDIKIETGGKVEMDHIQSTSNVYLLSPTTENYDYSPTQSSSIDYSRNVYAAYLSATFKMFKFLDIKTGLRDEYTDAKATFSNTGLFSFKPYNTIVPSAVIAHTFQNKQIIKLSYSHRIQRPEYRDLNPFINASDPKNISTGNPNLRPEIGDKIELAYSQTFKKGTTIAPSLFYRGNKDDIQSYTTLYSTYKMGDSTLTNVSVSTRENIGREDNFGASLFASIPINDKINIRGNVSCFERFINTGMVSGGDIHGFNYRTNMNVSYQINSTFIVELLGNFYSPRINAQGKMPAFTTYNFAFRKQLFHKKGSFALTATNFLNKYVDQKMELTGQNFTTTSIRQLPYRSFGFNFSYKFGKMNFSKQKEIEDSNLNPQGN